MSTREINVPVDGASTTAIVYPAQGQAAAALILAHGAGAGQRHPFMVGFAQGLSERGIDAVTFNFLYTEQGRRVPDRMPQLVACYEAVIAATLEHLASARERLCIGGKSMGGRAATHVAAGNHDLPIAGLVLLGYPLHPPGRPDKLRDAHLRDVKRPMLFVQGTRDTFGTPAELSPILERLSPLSTLHVVEGGDHSFKIAGRDAKARQAEVDVDAQDGIAAWMSRRSRPS